MVEANKPAPKGGFLRLLKAVFWSFFGVRRRSDLENDATAEPAACDRGGIYRGGAVYHRVAGRGAGSSGLEIDARRRRGKGELPCRWQQTKIQATGLKWRINNERSKRKPVLFRPASVEASDHGRHRPVDRDGRRWRRGSMVNRGRRSRSSSACSGCFSRCGTGSATQSPSPKAACTARTSMQSYRWSMSWFIFSEVMFFGAFFGALFYARADRAASTRQPRLQADLAGLHGCLAE